MSSRIRTHRKALIASAAGVVLAASAITTWFVIHRGPETMPTATCGGVVEQMGSSGLRIHEEGPGALACFRHAAESCQSASLLVTEAGVDTGTNDVIALRRTHGTCTARVTEQTYMLTDWGPVHHFDCGRVAVDDSGETVPCGVGSTFAIPLSAG